MATIDYSVGFSVVEIEEILAVHKQELKKTLTAYANDGSSYTKRHIDEIHTVIKACPRRVTVDAGREAELSIFSQISTLVGTQNA